MKKTIITFIFAALFGAYAVTLISPEKEEQIIVEAIPVEGSVDHEKENLEATIQYQQSLIQELADELETLQKDREDFIESQETAMSEEWKRQDFAFNSRVGISEWEDLQITNWFKTYAGGKESKQEAFHDFLKKLISEEKYEAYLKYVDDMRDSRKRMRGEAVLAELIFIPNLSEEQKRVLYERAYLSTENHPPFEGKEDEFLEVLEKTLSEDQLVIFDQYINL